MTARSGGLSKAAFAALRKLPGRVLDLLRRVRTRRQRSEVLTGVLYRGEQFQTATFTAPDRHPALFAQCSRLLEKVAFPRILSFGCSTGEEAQSLLLRIPHASILGVDINRWCLREAGRNNRSESIRFAHVQSAEFRQASGFDAIFCMAVFQYAGNRNAGTERVRGNLTFERFEQELTVLDRRLIPGGLLFLDNADFLFMDTVLSSRYEAVVFPGSSKRRRRPVFGRDNRKVAEESTAERCFRKRAAHGDTCSRNSSTLYT